MIWILAKIAGIVLGIYLIRKDSPIAKVFGWGILILTLLDIFVVLN